MSMRMREMSCGVGLAALMAAPAAAQETGDGAAAAGDGSAAVSVLSDWSYESLYEYGWSVDALFDEADVVDVDGAVIGDVENLIFRDDGELIAVIAEIGGFLDIGDTHVSVPWDEVTMPPGGDHVGVPIDEGNLDAYAVGLSEWFGEAQRVGPSDLGEVTEVDNDLETGAALFKATDLIGDFANLSDERPYGYVTDLIVAEGMINAIVVNAVNYGHGYYAYPYSRGMAGQVAYGPAVRMPYGAAEVGKIGTFDYDRLQGGGT